MILSRLSLLAIPVTTIAFFASAKAEVQISEIMYHPASENSAEEYIELYNPDAVTVNISGWKFTSGISFTIPAATNIPPGGRLVVAANAAAFSAKYPAVTNFVAGWTGQLSNSGNTITLKDDLLVTRDSVSYADDGDWATRRKDAVADLGYRGWAWFSAADGGGKSLELINPALDNAKAQNWGDSTTADGTPGSVNSIAAANVAPFITDVEHFPLLPRSTDPVTINARLLDESTSGLTATLFYKLDAAATFTSTPMFDDGAHNDGLAGDGRYGAQIPAQANGAIVEFYVEAADAAANTRTWPKAAQDYDTGTSTYFTAQVANCLYQVDNTVYAGAMPIYRLITKAADRTTLADINNNSGGTGGSHAKFNMTWITVDGTGSELRYTSSVRNRGHGSGGHDPQSFHVSFTNDHDWKGRTGLNLNTYYTYLQLFGSALMRKAELACFESRQVQVRINATDLTQAGGLSADGGRSYYFYVANENPDTNYADHHFPTDSSGNIYSVRREDSPGTLEGNLDYLGADPNSYRTVYFKDTNVSEDNWSDLLGLTLALSKGVSTTLTNVSYTPDTATYAADIQSKIDVAQWMKWFAAENLVGNNETNLLGGYGDDYYLYFGKTDIRAKLLPHDLDTILGHGDQNASDSPATFSATDSIFQMNVYHGSGTTPTPLNAFIRHPSFAPLFYQAHLDLMNGPLSQANFDALADQVLTGVVAAPTIANRKTWYAARLAYVSSQIPVSISGIVAATTGGTTLTVQSGYSRSTSANCRLSGRSHAGRTRSVKVNGTLASWDAFNATWTVNPLALTPGINRIKIEAFDSAGAEFDEVYTDVWYDDASVASVSGTLAAGTTTWTAAGGPYQITANLTVPATGTLIIQPGTTVYVNSGITVSVAGGGKILAEGTEANPIRFTRAPGGTGNGGTITLNGAAGASESHFYYTYFEFGGDPAITCAANSNIVVDHCEFGRTDVAYMHLDGGSFLISHTIFPTATAGTYFEGIHGANAAPPAGGRAIMRDCFLGKMHSISSDYNDVFDFTGGNRPGPILQFFNNVCIGSDDDILDIDGTDMWVEGNIFMNVHRSGSPDSASAISGGNDGGGGTGSRRAATAIDTATDQVTCGTHGFATGQEVVATALLGNTFPAATPALRNGSYFVRVVSTTVVKLYTSAADVTADTNAINFTGGIGTGVSLSLCKLDAISHITIVGNLFYNLDQVATAKEGNFYTLLNNTVVNQTNAGSQDAVTGVVNFGDDTYHESSGMYLEGNIIHSAAALTRNYPGAGLAQNVTFNNNLLPSGMTWTGAGSGNTNADALLNDVRNNVTGSFTIPTPGPRNYERLGAQIRQQFGLKNASPGKGTGPNGTDKGGVRTLGVSLSGAPTGTTNSSSATVNVGTRVSENGIASGTGAWANGAGWTHYKWRLDGGAWSAETANTAPISLTGLANGTHTLEVVGKNDAGLYQDDAALGTSSRIASATWTVDSAYVPPAAAPIVRINEVLASNTETIGFSGVFPDIIELTNVGNATADLSGWGITDNTALPYKYTIPTGTTLAPGAYLIIYASNSGSVTGLKTGFSLKQSGDDLTITKSAAQGGTVADTVAWGPQLSDYSISRALDGSWALGIPSFGAANRIAPTADVSTVRINEWLADAVTLFANDFVELYNPNTLPVDIGGCYLTDNPAEFPNRSLIQPLTFIGNSGYISFKADGDTTQGPDHANFRLSPLQGEIGLMSPAQSAIDVVIYGPQTTDISQGRTPNGSLSTNFFTQPTPGAPNPSVSTSTNTVVVMPPLQTWKYWANATTAPANDGSGNAYTVPAYDDAAWTAAAGQILHIEPDNLTWGFGFVKTTTLPGYAAPRPYQTYYFRTHFNYTGPIAGTTFTARIACDDGCVITVNGNELPRIRVAAGAVTFATQATNVTDGTVDTITIPTAYIVNGDNVIAVSVHQSNTQSATAGSSDVVWGMQLEASYTTSGATLVVNEVFPINGTYTNPDTSLHGWIELYNSSGGTVNLQDYSLTDAVGEPRKFVFPAGASIAGNGYYVIQCNGLAAASATNTGFNLNGAGDQIYLFNPPANGGGLADSVVFGQQLADHSVARIPNATGPFALAVPTRAALNSAAATSAITNVKLNEWLSSPPVGQSSWLELFNSAASPVLLSGNYLTDSFGNKTKHLIPPLTYLGASGNFRWLQLIADNDSSATINHVNFTVDAGEGLWLFSNSGAQLDAVSVTARPVGVSEGRFADGSATIVALTPTPGTANQQPNADSDGDGIPDAYELANGLNPNNPADAALDADGDGQSNKAEFLAGTNPQLPGSRLTAVVAATGTPGQFGISFTAIAGKTYTVRYKDDLSAATWTNLQQISAQPSDTLMTVNDTPGVPKRFYQVVTPQQP
ncbi:MAG: Inner spore coat protein [Verrucomicrobiota bacterium]|jgi:hypothetical protein